MPSLGPIPSDIVILTDYPERGDFNIRAVTDKLSKLGVVTTSCFITSLLESPPPLVDGSPDIDEYIKNRKTCPGTGWVSHKNKWIAEPLNNGFKNVQEKLKEVQPKLIIGLGKAPLFCFTGNDKIASWRGSRLSLPDQPFTLLPTIHPRTLVKQPDQKFILDLDLTRAYNIYTGRQLPRVYSFITKPSFNQVTETLLGLLAKADERPLLLSGDIETRAGHTACMGIAWSPTQAICIPHLVISEENPFYWSVEDEAFIVNLYAQLFHHPNITWLGQNFSYDCQYFWRHWGILPITVRDTMVGHHSLHSNIRKGLDFLSSIYAHDHVYWKDEIKEWDPKIGELQYWQYNCKDACITYEIWLEIEKERERE